MKLTAHTSLFQITVNGMTINGVNLSQLKNKIQDINSASKSKISDDEDENS